MIFRTASTLAPNWKIAPTLKKAVLSPSVVLDDRLSIAPSSTSHYRRSSLAITGLASSLAIATSKVCLCLNRKIEQTIVILVVLAELCFFAGSKELNRIRSVMEAAGCSPWEIALAEAIRDNDKYRENKQKPKPCDSSSTDED
jgi:hypothetical protein